MIPVLITGGAGNIASHLANKLLATNKYQVVVVDNLTTGDIHKIPKHPHCKFIKADVNNLNELMPVFLKNNFQYVFHFAALVGVKRTLSNPLGVFNDITGIRNILDLSKSCGVERVFYSSSSEVYGEPVSIPQNENLTPLNSRLPYAIVKNLGESMCKAYLQEYGLNYTIFRFFNTYGPMQNEDFVIPRFIRMALRGESISIYGDGMQTRTFCHVEDTTSTCLRILEEQLIINDVINIGSDVETTMLELATLVQKLTNNTAPLVFLPALPEGDMRRRCPDTSKMKSILQRNLIPLEQGIQLLVAHYQKPTDNN